MGGQRPLAKLRQIDPGVRAIVSSGYSSDPVRPTTPGFVAAIPKPYSLEHCERRQSIALATTD